ncbi:MAG: AAA family ATPase [Acidimicrobiales bacterium]
MESGTQAATDRQAPDLAGGGSASPEGPRATTSGDATRFAELHGALARNLADAIAGKAEVIDLLLLALIAEGHVLVEDVPGVGKTTLAKALAGSIDGRYGRIQFTPDLLPADVVGVNVWNRATGSFDFRPGPVFANVVLADEINRASPKTQSALLEAMAERQVTIDGATRRLPPPFLVIATQNPIESEGTYPLPESQLDRFLLKVSVGYPARDAELSILETHGDGEPLDRLRPVVTAAQVNGLAAAARSVHVAPPLQGYLVDLAAATRAHPHVEVGMSPRATLALQRVARARAATRGRRYVVPDDIKALAEPVLAHRILLTPSARVSQVTPQHVVADVLARVPLPQPEPSSPAPPR